MDCTNTNVALACFNGTTVLVHVIDDGNGKPQTRFINANGDIVVGATLANTTLGACVIPANEAKLFPGGTNIAAGSFAATHDPLGNGAAWTPVLSVGMALQSFTVTAVRAGLPLGTNGVRIRFAQTGSEVYLAQGQSFTWSVAQDNGNISEIMDPEVSVECFGNSAAAIAWTEQ